jgi:hypothetical protein
MAAFLANPGPSGGHDHSASLAANPTGFACTAPAPCAGGTFGGTITTGNNFLAGNTIHWDNTATGAIPSVTPTCNSFSPCDLFAVDPNLKYPYVTNWSLGITHAFNNNLSLEVGYVGNHGTGLTGLRDLNQNAVVNGVTTGGQPYATQFPAFRYINYVSNDAHSNYNGLQATFTQRVTHGLSFTSGYTYSHGLDNGSLSRFGGLPVNSYDVAREYASGDLDVRHHWTFSAGYDIPGKKGFGQLLEGWKINTIVTLQSGMPWNVFDTGNNIANTGPAGGEEVDRWNINSGFNPNDFVSGSSSFPYCTGTVAGGVSSCTQTSGISGLVTPLSAGQSAAMWNQCVTSAADTSAGGTLESAGCFVSGKSVMTPPAANHFGNMGRNILHDSGFKDWDFSVFKSFKFTERFGAQFRFEVFNVLNHPIIANPVGAAAGSNLGSDPSSPATFGCGCATPDVADGNALLGSGSGRVMQLGLKLSF